MTVNEMFSVLRLVMMMTSIGMAMNYETEW
jgi:hypothetical protein